MARSRDTENGGDAFDRFMERGFDVPPDVVEPGANHSVAALSLLAVVLGLVLVILSVCLMFGGD